MNIKKIYENMPGIVNRAAGHIGRYQIIYSKAFRKQYCELKKMDSLTEEEKRKLQLEKLRELLIYAEKYIPYYQTLFEKVGFRPNEFQDFSEFEKIPFLTRDIIRDNETTLQSKEIKNFYYATTGGTSGKPIKIAFDYASLYRERAFVYHYWSKLGFDYKKSKLISFRELQFDGKIIKYNTMYNEIVVNLFLLDSENLSLIVQKIQKFGGEFLYGYPSLIAVFCRLLKKNQIMLDTSIKAIFLISENLYPDQYRQIREVFDCKIAIFYGHTEKSVFAESYNDVYTFNPFYGYTEILPNEDDNIVCTGFINRKMPLIRYRVDDKAVSYQNVYMIIGHRENEFLYGKNDYIISATAIEFSHEEAFTKVTAYQFEQKELGKVTMKLETETPLSETEIETLQKKVLEKLPSFEVNLEIVKQIERTARGKYKMIIQKIPK